MNPARIAELLEPFLEPANGRSEPAPSEAKGLTTNDLQNISTYIDLLLRWNARINLTAVRDPEDIVTRHFGESLFAARHLFPSASASSVSSGVKGVAVADLGSGAGFPGLPLKLWAPPISLTLIESNHKKAAFLREVTRVLTLTDVNIQTARAESLSGVQFNLVTLRAVERFATILPIAADLLAPGGRLALLIGSAQLDMARAVLPRLSWSKAQPIPLSNSRVLAVARRLSQEPIPHNRPHPAGTRPYTMWYRLVLGHCQSDVSPPDFAFLAGPKWEEHTVLLLLPITYRTTFPQCSLRNTSPVRHPSQ